MRQKVLKIVSNRAFWRGVASIVLFLVLWELGARSKQWMAADVFLPLREFLGAVGLKKDYLPWIGAVPAPSAVLASLPSGATKHTAAFAGLLSLLPLDTSSFSAGTAQTDSGSTLGACASGTGKAAPSCP